MKELNDIKIDSNNEEQKIRTIVKMLGTPIFVYSSSVINNNINRMIEAANRFNLSDRIKVYVSYFSNSNPQLHSFVKDKRVGLLLQTEEEYHHLQKFNINKDLVASPSFLSEFEIDFWVSKNITVNLASLDEVKYVLNKYPNYPLSFRIDFTFKQNQRTGIKKRELIELVDLLRRANKIPLAFHVYTGTGSSFSKMIYSAKKTIKIYKKYFPEVKEINFGGGFNFIYEEKNQNKKHFAWNNYFQKLDFFLKKENVPDDVILSFEPGRDMLADAGSFVTTVKRIVTSGNKLQLATDASFVYIPSITKRKRSHIVDFLTLEKCSKYNKGMLSGSTTLSSDYLLPKEVNIPENIRVGDLIVIRDVGAYGATQHLEFLNKRPAPEVIIDGDKLMLLTERGLYDDRVRYVLSEPKSI